MGRHSFSVVSSMLALRWIEENVIKYRESNMPTMEAAHAVDYGKRLELLEAACMVFAIPVKMLRIWSRIWFSRVLGQP